jgi:ABC-type nitrate/sulfonate/bicarbonate transport system substrate-binding protein
VQQLQVPLASIAASSAPLQVAVDYGLFRRQGLEVELNGMAPAAATQALSAGSVPIAVTGGSTVTAWVGGATNLVFIAGLSNKAVFKIMGRPEIGRLEDLRGKAVGSTTAGSGATLALFETLRRFGLQPDRDVEMIYLREQPAVVAGLLGGGVQGAVLGSPFAEQAQAQGARILVDMRELNIEMLALNLTTTREQLERAPDLLRRFLMAYIQGIQYAREQPAAAIESIMRLTRDNDRAEAEAAYALYREVWNPWPSEAAIQALLDNMDVPGASTARPADMIDDRLLRELERSGWLAANYRPS